MFYAKCKTSLRFAVASSVAMIFALRKHIVWAPGQGVTATTSWRAPGGPLQSRPPRDRRVCGALATSLAAAWETVTLAPCTASNQLQNRHTGSGLYSRHRPSLFWWCLRSGGWRPWTNQGRRRCVQRRVVIYWSLELVRNWVNGVSE